MSELASTGKDTGRVAKALDSLPTLPIVALRIGEVIHSNNVSVNQVAELLRTDPATSAKLLRLVNSPYFGIPGGVSDVARAIPFVGFNTLYQLVLSIGVLEALDSKNASFDPTQLWLHSLTVGTAARELATDLKFSDPGACFTAGLLHDMGKIALAKLEPEKLAKVYVAMRDEGMSMHDAEVKFDLPAHDRIGSRLARTWRFPATLATPIEQHHSINQPSIRERLAPNLRSITEIVCAADYVSQRCTETFTGTGTQSGIAEDGDTDAAQMLERNGFSGSALEALCDRTKSSLEKSKVFLSLLK